MTETDTKPWWQSKTKIGILVSSVAAILSLFGVVVDVGVITEVAFGVAVLVGNWCASHGRNTADTPIDKKLVLPGLRLP